MRYMRDYYAPDGYDGCSNCEHQPSPYNLCDYGKAHPSIVVCPRWQTRITEKGRDGRMTNQEWLAKQIEKLPPEEVYDILYNIVINIGSRYNTSRGGVADWLMRDAILDEVDE